ncbi:MAG: condensation domain-containing protein [Mycobacterium sp.]|nr:condensation domain-containing protein [Mycobacterium sp.]
MVAIGSINLWQPGRGPVTTWTASPASREIMAQATRDPLQPTAQQAQHVRKAHQAKLAERATPRLIMVGWDMDGWCDVAAMTEAINTHVRRHDTYHSVFEVDGDVVARRTIDDPDRIEFVPAALGFLEDDEIREHVLTATPGTLEWDCFIFGVVQKADHFTVFASIDHLHTDGMSAGLIHRDINLTYQSLLHGIANPLPLSAGYRDFTARQALQVSAMTAESRPIKDWVDFVCEAEGNMPSFPLELGEPLGTGAGAAITTELLDAEETEAFDTACRAAGARFSGGGMACAALADHHFTGTEVFNTFTPSDTRIGTGHSLSAGWYASIFPVSVPVTGGDFALTARVAQKSFDANKYLSAVPFQRVMDLVSLEDLGVTPATRPSMMVSLMDFRNMPDADANRLGIYIDNLNEGSLNIWIARHADQTTVTVSFPDTAEARHSVHVYLAVLRSVFAEAASSAWAEPAADTAFAHSA